MGLLSLYLFRFELTEGGKGGRAVVLGCLIGLLSTVSAVEALLWRSGGRKRENIFRRTLVQTLVQYYFLLVQVDNGWDAFGGLLFAAASHRRCALYEPCHVAAPSHWLSPRRAGSPKRRTCPTPNCEGRAISGSSFVPSPPLFVDRPAYLNGSDVSTCTHYCTLSTYCTYNVQCTVLLAPETPF